MNTSRNIPATFIGGNYVVVKDHGRLWAVREMKSGNLRVQVDGKAFYLRSIHSGFSPATGGSLSTYTLGDEAAGE